MNYLGTSINESPVISLPAGAAITDVRGYAVKFNASGAVVLAGAGDTPLGIGIMTNGDQGAIAQGENVDIQYKDIGLVCAGAAITAGASLSVNASGQFIPATSSTTAVAVALQAAAGAGQCIQAILKIPAPAVA